MADSVIYSAIGDSVITEGTNDGSWNDARGSATTDGGDHRNDLTVSDFGVYNGSFGSRGSSDYRCSRSYFAFDLRLEEGEVSSAAIQIYMDNLGSSGISARAAMVEAAALDDSVADHGNVFKSGTAWHNSIANVAVISTTAGYHKFTMNSDGITLIQNAIGSDFVTVGLVGFWYDYSGYIPTGGGNYTKFKIFYSDYIGTAVDPKMEITYTRNATFFGANF